MAIIIQRNWAPYFKKVREKRLKKAQKDAAAALKKGKGKKGKKGKKKAAAPAPAATVTKKGSTVSDLNKTGTKVGSQLDATVVAEQPTPEEGEPAKTPNGDLDVENPEGEEAEVEGEEGAEAEGEENADLEEELKEGEDAEKPEGEDENEDDAAKTGEAMTMGDLIKEKMLNKEPIEKGNEDDLEKDNEEMKESQVDDG